MTEHVKLFISQAMSGISTEDAMMIRSGALHYLRRKYPDIEFEVIENYEHKDAPKEVNKLWHLGRSIQQLGDADYIYFCKDEYSRKARGVKVEKFITKLYKIPIIK